MTGLVLGTSAGFLACGGDDTTNNPADGGGGDATLDTGGGFDSATGQDTSTGSDTSTGQDSSGGDAGSDAPLDVQLIQDSGSTVTDSGPGGDAAILSCGSAQCQLPNETCCVYPESPSFYVACSNGAACPTLFDAGGGDAGLTAVALQCEDKENCGGNLVCCIYATSADGGAGQSHCTDSCTGGEKHAILCDQTAADAGCGDAGACSNANIQSWGLPSGFATCGGVLR